ncbi:MAG: L-seryl-tRNA(Sec) selenium transferase [Bacteroidales bacterium]|nr:L-seryl-tRNA(Sec) selenium transferase [Bacteroidales bacterium]MDD4154985.1 L-seryl-tRNA(Sec) selenium transferase [Candidatus Cloacimonadota bacterium]
MLNDYKWIPSVNKIIDEVLRIDLFNDIDKRLLASHIRQYLGAFKKSKNNLIEESSDALIQDYVKVLKQIILNPLKSMINATGIVIHTNIGRAPYGDLLVKKAQETLSSYTNIEFSLENGNRAYRDDFLQSIFNFITGSEDVVIVNNNAAAVYLILKQYAQDKEVIVSRGELIEIGGSFRIPDIMDNSGAILKEVGTTNCTRINDYEQGIGENTGLLFKAHTSNYSIQGHTEQTKIEEIIELSKKNKIPFVYDAGCGMIKAFDSMNKDNFPKFMSDTNELDISNCLKQGVDIVCFSADKILGSVQAGIILGKKKYLAPLKKNPLMRILRVDKFTITSLYHTLSNYVYNDRWYKNIPVFQMLNQNESILKRKAERLSLILENYNLNYSIIKSSDKVFSKNLYAQIGGGSFPNKYISSYLIRLNFDHIQKTKLNFADKIYRSLLQLEKPILTVRFERSIYLNLYTLSENDFDYIAKSLAKLIAM